MIEEEARQNAVASEQNARGAQVRLGRILRKISRREMPAVRPEEMGQEK